ncbi:MAG: glycosyltransferase, partial [Gammaproteobacteria bacterium]|nr:glycosyltransferase [Gammaproteobacteria bacterium]
MPQPGPSVTVIVPTLNERGNVHALVERLDRALVGEDWEVIFVDDDSTDGTAAVVRELGRSDRRVRCVQRLGRRGLSGACLEGMLASSATYIAIIDGD